MFLEEIEYSQFGGKPRLWKLESCTLGKINLIVGKNATGKSKTLNVVNGLANLLSGRLKLQWVSGKYVVKFHDDEKDMNYVLHFENTSIIKEELTINRETKLKRGKDGIGSIYYAEERKLINFQAPPAELAAVVRRDKIQHPFLEELYNWGKYARHYPFGTDLGRLQLVSVIENKEKAKQRVLDPKNTNLVVEIFMEGKKRYPDKFVKKILNDMNTIGYSLNEIGLRTPEGISIRGDLPPEPVGLYVKENDLSCRTDQTDMSQGMFRALSLIIQFHYSLFTGKSNCILIDDIGDGLDFERSSALVKLLIKRAKNTAVQLIMTTNDRFIMNSVPLEYWLVIQRIGGISKIHNQGNSPRLFDDFELTGLNNFDFFSSEYYRKDDKQN